MKVNYVEKRTLVKNNLLMGLLMDMFVNHPKYSGWLTSLTKLTNLMYFFTVIMYNFCIYTRTSFNYVSVNYNVLNEYVSIMLTISLKIQNLRRFKSKLFIQSLQYKKSHQLNLFKIETTSVKTCIRTNSNYNYFLQSFSYSYKTVYWPYLNN